VIARVALCAALAGCYAFPTMGRARTVGRGELELWVAPEALVIATPGSAMQQGGGSIRPLVETGARYGVTDRVDLDARVGTFGISAGARAQLVRAPTPECGIDVAIAPALALTLPDKPSLELPVLVGWNLRGRHQIIASARVVYQQHYGVGGVSGPVSFAYAGGSIGFAWQVWRHVALVPELAVLTQVYAPAGFTSELPNAIGIQAGIGLLWDR
jgi:hypothetical protein